MNRELSKLKDAAKMYTNVVDILSRVEKALRVAAFNTDEENAVIGLNDSIEEIRHELLKYITLASMLVAKPKEEDVPPDELMKAIAAEGLRVPTKVKQRHLNQRAGVATVYAGFDIDACIAELRRGKKKKKG